MHRIDIQTHIFALIVKKKKKKFVFSSLALQFSEKIAILFHSQEVNLEQEYQLGSKC